MENKGPLFFLKPEKKCLFFCKSIKNVFLSIYSTISNSISFRFVDTSDFFFFVCVCVYWLSSIPLKL